MEAFAAFEAADAAAAEGVSGWGEGVNSVPHQVQRIFAFPVLAWISGLTSLGPSQAGQ